MQKMKDSGIEWIGDIPEGWKIGRFKFIAPLQCGYAFKADRFSTEYGVPLVRMGNLKRGKLDLEEAVKVQEEDIVEDFFLKEHDILLGLSGSLGDTGSLGNYAIVSKTDLPCLLNQRVGRFVISNKIISNLLIYIISTDFFKRPLELDSTGTAQFNISPTAIGEVSVPLPPLSEQQRIADYLDAKCARIDESAELIRQSMEKLRAYKLSLITEAVTKGLDPDVPMKDSGIPWIGEIPAGWEVRRLKTISDSIVVGIVINPSQYISDVGVPYVYGGDIQEGKIDFISCRKISHKDSLKNEKTILASGDILTVRVGYPGISAVVPEECEGGNCASVILTRKGNFNSWWYCYCLNSKVIKAQIDIVKYGAAQEQFNLSHMVEFSIPVPPLAEQQRIADYLDAKCARIDALLEEKERLLDRLAEYKKSLIFECVTGKREVSA